MTFINMTSNKCFIDYFEQFFFTYCWYKNNLVGISGFFFKEVL